jgi:O-antigen/teichoic acid export membrane protein
LYVGIQQHAIGIIALVAKRVDVFLVASLLTLQDAGFYAAGILIPQAIVSIPRATMWPLVSAFSDSKADVPEIVTRVSRLQVLLMGVIALILLPWGQVIVTTLFGDAFSPSVAPFRWALPGLLFTPVTITVNAILTARARPGLSILSALVGTGVQLVLTLLLLPRWGTSGGAAALSANFVTTALVQLLIMRSEGIDARTLLIATRQDLAALGKALRAQVPAW